MKTKKAVTRGRAKRRTPVTKTAKARIRRARPIHKRVLLHPVSAFMLLCIGVILSAWTYNTFADSLTVNARVNAPLPTSGAPITSPADQTRFSSTPITVIGNCPLNTYVELFRNGIFSGVANCDAPGSYHILTDLSPGANILQPKVFNITDNQGPDTPSITVWYDPPVVQNQTAPTRSTTNTSLESTTFTPSPVKYDTTPMTIIQNYQHQIYPTGSTITWNIAINGGVAPFAVTTNWQDGTIDTLVRTDNAMFQLSHTYHLPNVQKHTYAVKVSIVDSRGDMANMQLMATVVNKNAPPETAAGLINSGLLTNLKSIFDNWIWVVWPFYLVVLLMAISFFLGERQEFARLVAPSKRPHNHHYAK